MLLGDNGKTAVFPEKLLINSGLARQTEPLVASRKKNFLRRFSFRYQNIFRISSK